MEEMIYSFSRLTTFRQCNYSFYLNYIEEAPQENNSWGVGGGHSHDVLEAYYKGEIPLEGIADYWLFTAPQLSFPTMKPNYLSKYVEDCYNFFKALEQGIWSLENEVIGVEREFIVDIEGKKLKGFIDLETRSENGKIQILDWKTSGMSSFTGKKLAEKARQLFLYAISQKEKWGQYPDEIQFVMMRYGKTIKIPFTMERMEEAKRWMLETVDMIEKAETYYRNEDFFFCKNICGHTTCDLNGRHPNNLK